MNCRAKKDKMRIEIYLEDKLTKEDRGDYEKVKEVLENWTIPVSEFWSLETPGSPKANSKRKSKNFLTKPKPSGRACLTKQAKSGLVLLIFPSVFQFAGYQTFQFQSANHR